MQKVFVGLPSGRARGSNRVAVYIANDKETVPLIVVHYALSPSSRLFDCIKLEAGEMSVDFPYDGVYEGVYKERQYGAANALYAAMDIARGEKDKRQAAFMRNFSFFDAPHVAFLFLPEPFGLREACDLGMFAQTLMLALTAEGIGSCPQTALSFQADYVRDYLGVSASNKLVCGISFGYAETDAAVNTCTTDRAALADAVTFHS